MKWIFFVIVLSFLFYRTVYGAKSKEIVSLHVDPLVYTEDGNYFKAGLAKKISCRGSTKNQKVDWYDPSGHIVKHQPNSRIHVQDNVVPPVRASAAARSLLLLINHATVSDSGVWECRSGDMERSVSLCVLDPVEFVDSKTEVTVDLGRAITLSCQARGEPEPTIIWERNGEVIAENDTSSKYKVMTSYQSQWLEGLLTVTSLKPGDSGVYTCVTYQENQLVDDCSYTKSLNVTLNINYGPIFEIDNETVPYFGNDNERVNLSCAADAFPAPTYKWFHEDDRMLTEIPRNYFTVSKDGNEAILSVTANSSTFGKIYACRATNPYGDAYMRFVIWKVEVPQKPSEVLVFNYTGSTITLNMTWEEDLYVPLIESIEVQYIQKTAKATPRYWGKAHKAEFASGNAMKLTDLKENTEYWIRLRLANSAGYSGWTAPLLAGTGSASEEEEQIAESDKEVEAESSNGSFYGLLFAGAVLIIAAGCTYLIKRG